MKFIHNGMLRIKLILSERLKKPQLHFNEHVLPSWQMCDVCNNNFSFIGTYETRIQDLNYLSDKLNLEFPNITAGVNRRVGRVSAEKLVDEEMSKLSPEKRDTLCNFLKFDFLIFGYESSWCSFKFDE